MFFKIVVYYFLKICAAADVINDISQCLCNFCEW